MARELGEAQAGKKSKRVDQDAENGETLGAQVLPFPQCLKPFKLTPELELKLKFAAESMGLSMDEIRVMCTATPVAKLFVITC